MRGYGSTNRRVGEAQRNPPRPNGGLRPPYVNRPLLVAYARLFDDLSEPRHLRFDQGAELLRRAADRLDAGLEEALLHLRLPEHVGDLLVEPCDDGPGRAGRDEYADERGGLVIAYAG